jgi:hypothetical protein
MRPPHASPFAAPDAFWLLPLGSSIPEEAGRNAFELLRLLEPGQVRAAEADTSLVDKHIFPRHRFTVADRVRIVKEWLHQ